MSRLRDNAIDYPVQEDVYFFFKKEGTRQKGARVHPVSPDILVRQIWQQDRERNGVKVIELGSKDQNIDNENLNSNHTLNVGKHDCFIVDSPIKNINSKASERKRIEITNKNRNQVSHQRVDLEMNERYMDDLILTGFHDSFSNKQIEGNVRSYPINCFTIIKNTSTNESNSSSDNSDIEFLNCNDFSYNVNQYECTKDDSSCEQQSLAYNADVDVHNRTLWYYSFKNNHVTENVYSSSEYNSSTSTENCDIPVKDTTVARVPTPVPGMYVPRLNLFVPPTLPTVTEVTEPKQPANEILKHEGNVKKHVNGWFIDSSPKTKETLNNDDEKSKTDNVINWMCLSPRDKRKRYREAFRESFQSQHNMPMAREVSTVNENNSHSTIIYNKKGIKGEIIRSTHNFNLVKDITTEDVGDHDINHELKKPNIQISSTAKTRVVTGSIELLDSNNWIIEKELPGLKNEEDIKDLSRKLWAKNVILLNPAEWSQYFPVTESVPSLHLSLETVIEEEMTCFKRIFHCLKCFK